MLLGACQSPFDPQMALLHSFVLQLKVLNPHRLTHFLFWANIQLCMSYAKLLDTRRPSSELVKVLNELDNAATELTSHVGLDGLSFTAVYEKRHDLSTTPNYMSHGFYSSRSRSFCKYRAEDETSQKPSHDSELTSKLTRTTYQPHWTCTLWCGGVGGPSFLL